MPSSALLLLRSRASHPAPPVPIPRGPWTPWDPDSWDHGTPEHPIDPPAFLPVSKSLNAHIPPLSDPTFLRANLWGVTLTGAPPIPGGASGPAQNRLLTYLWDRYPHDWQDRWLVTYAQRRYRHFWLSIPDSRDGTGVSLSQYLELTERVADIGLIPCHFLRSKDYDGHNPDPTIVEPWVDALAARGLLTWACHAWEASIFYDPLAFRATIHHDAQRWPGTRWCVHLQSGYADFGPNGPNHGPIFWQDCLTVGVKTLLYQCDPAWSAGMMAARANDCLVRLVQSGLWGLPETVSYIPFELIATQQFKNLRDGDGRIADEDAGDRKSYEMLCAPGPSIFGGFGNGCRSPDGAVL